MAKQNKKAETATETLVATTVDTSVVTETTETKTETESKKGRKPSFSTVLKGLGILRIPTLAKPAKAATAQKEQLRIVGNTVDVAIIPYANWRASDSKWGVDEIVNGTDKKVAKKARFRPDLTAIVIDGVGQKYGGFISAHPKHVDEVVAKLREWQAANDIKPTFDELCATLETEEAVVEAIKAGNVRVAPQFTLLENFVEVPAKARKPRAKKTESVESTANVTDEVTA